MLPIALAIADNYLQQENETTKWVEIQKPLFKINLAFQTSVHTSDPHVANFFGQCEKLILSLNEVSNVQDELTKIRLTNLSLKRKAPILPAVGCLVVPPLPVCEGLSSISESGGGKGDGKTRSEIVIVVNDPSKEIMNNSLKVIVKGMERCQLFFLKLINNKLIY